MTKQTTQSSMEIDEDVRAMVESKKRKRAHRARLPNSGTTLNYNAAVARAQRAGVAGAQNLKEAVRMGIRAGQDKDLVAEEVDASTETNIRKK